MARAASYGPDLLDYGQPVTHSIPAWPWWWGTRSCAKNTLDENPYETYRGLVGLEPKGGQAREVIEVPPGVTCIDRRWLESVTVTNFCYPQLTVWASWPA